MGNYFFLEELIDLLKKRDYSHFSIQEDSNGFREANCVLYANDKADYVEVSVYAPDDTISEETADRMIDVLEHLDECIQKAYVWLSKQDLHDDWMTQPEYSPQELEQIFTMWNMFFGVSKSEPSRKKPHGGLFTLSFDLPDAEAYPWHYDVYFDYEDLQPYKSEKMLW